jgi:hypothetical protein
MKENYNDDLQEVLLFLEELEDFEELKQLIKPENMTEEEIKAEALSMLKGEESPALTRLMFRILEGKHGPRKN